MNQDVPSKLFVATKAIIRNKDNKVLVIRESKKYTEGTNEGYFDVVGGRIELGEKVHEALKREAKEETGLDVTVGKPFFIGDWRPVIKGEKCQIVGIFFDCSSDSSTVSLGDDHLEYRWIDPKNHSSEKLIESLHKVFEAYNTRYEKHD